jgi:hypothetical protein
LLLPLLHALPFTAAFLDKIQFTYKPENYPDTPRCAKHEREEAPQALVFLDKRIGKGRNQKSFAGTFLIS